MGVTKTPYDGTYWGLQYEGRPDPIVYGVLDLINYYVLCERDPGVPHSETEDSNVRSPISRLFVCCLYRGL